MRAPDESSPGIDRWSKGDAVDVCEPWGVEAAGFRENLIRLTRNYSFLIPYREEAEGYDTYPPELLCSEAHPIWEVLGPFSVVAKY
jgi:hypothetical protein